jgi:hypothetical protein
MRLSTQNINLYRSSAYLHVIAVLLCYNDIVRNALLIPRYSFLSLLKLIKISAIGSAQLHLACVRYSERS